MQALKQQGKIICLWKKWRKKHPDIIQFLMFFLISNGVTVLQIILMPLIKYVFNFTKLVNTPFQAIPVGHNLDGSIYFVFDYAAGAIADGRGGGIAYFLAVEITLFIAQVINFFLQRNVTFKSDSSVIKAAFWYFISWLVISVGAAALQGLYKTPVYNYLMSVAGASMGMTLADIATVFINSIISFWVFFPIMKVIFKQK